MKKIAYYNTQDKSDWGPGPWQTEPDKVQYTDITGLPALIVCSHIGSLCGYVGVPEVHPWHGVGYGHPMTCTHEPLHKSCYECDGDFSPGYSINVHGGITFSNFCTPEPNFARDICHMVEPGEPDHVWWFGFDCGHACDLSPAMLAGLVRCGMYRDLSEAMAAWGRRGQEIYRDIPYVVNEIHQMALQLLAVPLRLG